MPGWLVQLVVQGGVAAPLSYLVWRLVQQLVSQANAAAAAWQRTSEVDRQRADEAQKSMGEVLSALRSVESLIRHNYRDPV